MKLILAGLILMLSFTAYGAKKNYFMCNVGFSLGEQIPLEYHFSTPSKVAAYLVLGNKKIPLPETKLEVTEGFKIVTSLLSFEGELEIALAFKEKMFQRNESQFYIVDALINGHKAVAICMTE